MKTLTIWSLIFSLFICSCIQQQIKSQIEKLMIALQAGDTSSALIIVQKIDSINFIVDFSGEISDFSGKTPLMYSSERGYLNVTKALINKGAKLDLKNDFGLTALMYTCYSPIERPEVVRLLLNNGANLDLQDNAGETALIFACKEGHAEVVKILLEKAAMPKRSAFVL